MSSSTRWVWIGIGAYLLVAAVILLAPVSYGAMIDALWAAFGGSRDAGFGSGWIEFVANVLMFLPLGFLLTLLLRRHWLGVLLALALSAAAELAQIVIPSRQPSLRDVLANVLGAAIGAALAWLIVLRRERRRATDAAELDVAK